MSCLLFVDLVLRVDILRVIARGKFSPEANCPGDISMSMGYIPGGGARLSGTIQKMIRN